MAAQGGELRQRHSPRVVAAASTVVPPRGHTADAMSTGATAAAAPSVGGASAGAGAGAGAPARSTLVAAAADDTDAAWTAMHSLPGLASAAAQPESVPARPSLAWSTQHAAAPYTGVAHQPGTAAPPGDVADATMLAMPRPPHAPPPDEGPQDLQPTPKLGRDTLARLASRSARNLWGSVKAASRSAATGARAARPAVPGVPVFDAVPALLSTVVTSWGAAGVAAVELLVLDEGSGHYTRLPRTWAADPKYLAALRRGTPQARGAVDRFSTRAAEADICSGAPGVYMEDTTPAAAPLKWSSLKGVLENPERAAGGRAEDLGALFGFVAGVPFSLYTHRSIAAKLTEALHRPVSRVHVAPAEAEPGAGAGAGAGAAAPASGGGDCRGVLVLYSRADATRAGLAKVDVDHVRGIALAAGAAWRHKGDEHELGVDPGLAAIAMGSVAAAHGRVGGWCRCDRRQVACGRYWGKWRGDGATPVKPAPWAKTAIVFFGVLLTLLVMSGLNDLLLFHWSDAQYFVLIGSVGALMTLQFAVPASPLAQPRNAVLGGLVSATCGILCFYLGSEDHLGWVPMWVATAMAPAFGIASMAKLGLTHPPAGAAALIFVTGGARTTDLGFMYLLIPLTAGNLICCACAMVYNNCFEGRRYPIFW